MTPIGFLTQRRSNGAYAMNFAVLSGSSVVSVLEIKLPSTQLCFTGFTLTTIKKNISARNVSSVLTRLSGYCTVFAQMQARTAGTMDWSGS